MSLSSDIRRGALRVAVPITASAALLASATWLAGCGSAKRIVRIGATPTPTPTLTPTPTPTPNTLQFTGGTATISFHDVTGNLDTTSWATAGPAHILANGGRDVNGNLLWLSIVINRDPAGNSHYDYSRSLDINIHGGDNDDLLAAPGTPMVLKPSSVPSTGPWGFVDHIEIPAGYDASFDQYSWTSNEAHDDYPGLTPGTITIDSVNGNSVTLHGTNIPIAPDSFDSHGTGVPDPSGTARIDFTVTVDNVVWGGI